MKSGIVAVVLVSGLLSLPWVAHGQTYSKTESITYHDNTAKWVLGQTAKVTCTAPTTALPSGCGAAGTVISETTYDPTYALPLTTKSFGKLQQTLTYDTTSTVASGQLGTLKTVADGNNNITTLSSWKRGIPQAIKYPITTESPSGATQSAVVNDAGWITSVTDENGYKTCYGYDSMGRVSLITYPSETQLGVCDTSTWAATSIAFVGGNAAAYGMPAGHWRQTTLTGNGRKILIFDALWRPVVEQTLDLGNVSGTLSEVVKRYDVQGRVEFQSYPMNTNGLANYADTTLKGVWTDYDALDRATSVTQDSELGLLTTLTEYLTGFKTRVTNPKLQQTTTSYLAYDQPSYDMPVAITHPEGAFTDITRDVFGKPTVLKRRNSTSSLAITRSYAYNANQELCRSVEPETGATLTGYDAAGNLKWSAAGLPAATACEADGTSTAVAARRVDRTYDARNRVKTLSFPDGKGNQSWTYTPDGLPAGITTYNGAGNTLPVVNTYTYNKRRLMTAETSGQTGWYTWGLGYGYNANGHLASQSYPDGLSVAYVPNALGQPTQAGTYATGVSYYPSGAIKQFTYGNGIAHTLTQNARQLPARSTDNGVQDMTYAYDANANPVTIRDLNAVQYAYSGNRDLEYDGLDRLTRAHLHWWQYYDFTYDVLDNITSRTKSNGSVTDLQNYFYEGGTNRLVNIKDGAGATIVGLGYDVQGNLANKNGQLHSFDYGNRLREVTNKETYRYDGWGRRIESRDSNYAEWQYSNSGQLMFSHDARKDRGTNYIYLGGSLVALRERPLSGGAFTDKYQHTDALGSPVAATNTAGTVIERTNYEPYGAAINKPAYDGIGYTGHVMDGATGLTYMQQRYYDSGVGRFLSVDPVTADGNTGANFNRYKYASNNPYRFVDSDGRAELSAYWRGMVEGAGPNPYAPIAGADRGDAAFVSMWAGSAGFGAAAAFATPTVVAVASEVSQYGVINAVLANPAAVQAAGIVTLETVTAVVSGVPNPTSEAASAMNGMRLGKQLASEAQLGEVMAGRGAVIAGGATGKELRAASGLAQNYGGHAKDWTKVSSSSNTMQSGQKMSVHAYQNQATGQVVEPKTKLQWSKEK